MISSFANQQLYKTIRINLLPSPAVAKLATTVNVFSVFVFSKGDAQETGAGGNLRPTAVIRGVVHKRL